MIFRWIIAELKNSKRFTILFVANLVFGLSGFIVLQSLKSSIATLIDSNTKNYLSADYSVSVRRLFSDTELESLSAVVNPDQSSRAWEFMTMIQNQKSDSRLVQIKAVKQNYPFYGSLTLGSQKIIKGTDPKEIMTDKKAWVYPELLVQLNIKIGDKVKILGQEFVIADTIVDDATQTMRLSSLAPKIYLGFDQVQSMGISSLGVTLTDQMYFKFSESESVEPLIQKLNQSITDPAVRFTSPKEANQDVSRVLSYLSDYLSLVTMAAIFLCAIGCAFLIRYYLGQKVKTYAVYRALGMPPLLANGIYLLQIVVLGLVSAVGAYLISLVLRPSLNQMMSAFAPKDFQFNVGSSVLFVGLIISCVLAVLMSTPFLIRLFKSKPSDLFSESQQFETKTTWHGYFVWFLFLVFMLMLCFWQTKSLKMTFVFFGLMLGAGFFVGSLGFALLKLPLRFKNWVWHYGYLSFSRKKALSLSLVAVIGLSSCLLNLLPQLKTNIYRDFESPNMLTLPNLFMFDIQDEQLGPITEVIQQNNYKIQNLSPLIRARIIKINDKNFERNLDTGTQFTREQEEDIRFRNRGVNLSYRGQFADSEEVIQGDPSWERHTGGTPLLSVEYWYAERLGLKIGDELEFDVQGVVVKGKIHNLRKVKWNSFQPNFFVLFQEGVLESAPKIFLAGVYGSDKTNDIKLQNDIAKVAGNVSVITVSGLIQKILELSDRLTWSMQALSLLTLLVGLVILYSLVQFQLQQKAWDLNLLKLLGINPSQLRLYVLIEYLGPVALSIFIGSFISTLISWVLMKFVFSSTYVIDWSYLILVNLLILALTSILILLSTSKTLDTKPRLA